MLKPGTKCFLVILGNNLGVKKQGYKSYLWTFSSNPKIVRDWHAKFLVVNFHKYKNNLQTYTLKRSNVYDVNTEINNIWKNIKQPFHDLN